MIEIPLSQGRRSLVPDGCSKNILEARWCAQKIRKAFYATRSFKMNGVRHFLYLHRAVWEEFNGPISEGMQIDHINGDGLDNRLENLRICRNGQNHFNMRKYQYQEITTSQYKGVCLHKTSGLWHARINVSGKCISLKYFKSEIEAARAYNKAAIQYYGEFASLNIIEGEKYAAI